MVRVRVRVRVRFRVMFRRGDGWLRLGLCLGEGFEWLCLGIGSLFVGLGLGLGLGLCLGIETGG